MTAMVDKETILRIISDCQPCTWEDLLSKLRSEGSSLDDLREIRRVLAELVREGIIVKEPDYDRRKLMYRVRNSS